MPAWRNGQTARQVPRPLRRQPQLQRSPEVGGLGRALKKLDGCFVVVAKSNYGIVALPLREAME